MQNERYLALDGMRGIAALAVVLFHGRLAALHGYLAVDFFFMLSGFVIASSYEQRLASGSLDLISYMRLRVSRLYPMLFIGSMLGLGFYAMGRSHFNEADGAGVFLSIFSQFLLIPFASSSAALFALNNPQWSIIWELLVNAAHAISRPILTERVLVAVVIASAIALAVSAFHFDSLFIGQWKETWIGGPIRATFGFFVGVLLFRTRERWLERVPQVGFVVPAMIFFLLVNVPPHWVDLGRAFAIYDLLVVTLCFVPLVMLSVRARAGYYAGMLGTVSYPLYVINEPVMLYLTSSGFSDFDRAMAVAGLALAAWALGHWVDEPLNAWRKRAAERASRQSGSAFAA